MDKPNPSPMVDIGKIKSPAYLRTKLWREAHPDEYRTYMREYMKKRRGNKVRPAG